MRKKRFMLWIVFLIFGFLALPAISNAAVEGVQCPQEPTDMFIGYSDLVTCAIESIGDQDIFRFTGTTGEMVSLLATRRGGNYPCIWLYRPDGTLIASQCGNPAAGIGPILDQTGTYTLLVREASNTTLLDYAIVLERLTPPSTSARAIEIGVILNDEINPVGDQDIFYFVGKAGETVSLLATRQSGNYPCIWLYRPDGTLIASQCGNPAAGISPALDQTGTYTLLVREASNTALLGYSLDLQCIIGTCQWAPPDVAGCINLQGSPLANNDVILRQPLEQRQITTTDDKGCYKFDNAVSGKAFKVIIKGPALQ